MRFLFYVGRLGHRKPNLHVFSEMKMYFVTVFRRGIWKIITKHVNLYFFKKW